MERVPILQLKNILIVSLQGDIYDTTANYLQEDLGEQLTGGDIQGVLLDISALDIIDTYIGRVLANISEVSKIMGATTVMVGMQPSVAITLVELGMELNNIKTAINLDQGINFLRSLIDSSDFFTLQSNHNKDIDSLEEYEGIPED